MVSKGIQIQTDILNCILSEGMKSKKEIYDFLVEAEGYSRPTVRRSARDLRIKLKAALEILDQEGKRH